MKKKVNKGLSHEQKHDDLYKMRHSCEHLLHQAVVDLFPKAKRAMGPATEDGFYCDFDFDGDLSEKDFEKLENRMRELAKLNLPITRKEVSPEEARKLFEGNEYKNEWIDQAVEKKEKITVYWTGEEGQKNSDVDLCAGPHVESTGEVGPFKLLSVAGAYWHGNEKNKMLKRIYGTAFFTQEELDSHLSMLEEAKKRDHRKIGIDLGLFSFADPVGPGLPLWSPKGAIIREELENWAKETERRLGYQRVVTPHIAKHTLFEISGHLPYYKDDMYAPMDIDGEEYYLKAMNCPHHHMIYKSKPRSYRELPMRYAEYGTVYRNEQSGSLFGLMRVRSICQNDAHIYCTLEQAEEEFLNVLKLHEFYYDRLGIKREDYYIKLALPDESKRDKYHGDREMWDTAEKIMRTAVVKSGIRYEEDPGGAAFYGPKIDLNIRSVTGREFGASTNQLDLYMPTRFDLKYTDKDGSEKLCAVIHRAPLGSHERFIGFLIEHFAGAFPVWLSPVQVSIIPISESQVEFAHKLKDKMFEQGLRVEVDDRDEKMQAKIRDAQINKVPYMFIVGKREVEANSVSIRVRDGRDLGAVSVENAIKMVEDKYSSRCLDL